MSSKIKVVTIVGTRPEIIRLSCVMNILDKYTNHILVHTGQNYDYNLNEVFFNELDIKKPKYHLDIKNTSVGRAYGEIMIGVEKVLVKENPDAVLVLGDTNSSISAVIARRMKIPIYHMEAGNRSFDENVPEEVNRKIVDHISDFNLVYTERSRTNLLNEGISPRFIYLTGSPMCEVLRKYHLKMTNSGILHTLNIKEHSYILVSIHREENVDNLSNLTKIFETLEHVRQIYNKKIILTIHPRTENQIKKSGLMFNKNFIFHKPFSFIEYGKLQKCSFCVISDSGTISEESTMMKFPAVTIRNSMERPEALDAGSMIITGFDKDVMVTSIKICTSYYMDRNEPSEYFIENTSERVLKLIVGTCKLKNKWKNIEVK